MVLRQRSPFFVLPLIFAIAVSGCAHSRLKVGQHDEGEVVEAEGLAPHNPSDMIQTKRASLVDAQRNAVEKAVGVFVSGKTLVEKAVAIENNILAKSDGYIKKYDILKEGPEAGLYKTRIRALVALKDLQEDLKRSDLLKGPELKRPRLTLAITEEIDKALLNERAATAALQNSLTEQGYVIVEGDRANEADLKIEGKASAYPYQDSGLGGFVSYRARFSVSAVRPGAKDVVVTVTNEASGLGGNNELAGLKALETVGTLVGEDLGNQLTKDYSRASSVLVYVEGVKTFGDAEALRKHIQSQPGVKDLMLRSFDEQMAQFEVQLNSIQSTELASDLEKSSTLPLVVLEAKAQTLRLKTK